MTDLNKYIDIPYVEGACGWDGCNCYGLFRLFKEHEQGILLPALEQEESRGGDVIANYIDRVSAKMFRKVQTPRFGDGVVFDISGQPRHIGIIIDHREMLHVEKGSDSCIEPYTIPGSHWFNNFTGFFEYVG